MTQKYSVPDHMKEYEEKYLDSSFTAISQLERKAAYVIHSKGPCISGLPLLLWKTERSYEFETDKIQVTSECLRQKDDMFGFASLVEISDGDRPVVLDRVKKLSYGLDPWVFKGVASEISSSFSVGTELFHRMLIPIGDDREQDFRSYVESKGIRVGSVYRGAGIIEVDIGRHGLQVFVWHLDKSPYLILDSRGALTSEEFQLNCRAGLLALGFLTGYLPRGEQYILQSLSHDRAELSGVQYSELADTIDSNVRVVNHSWNVKVNGKQLSWYLPSNTLCSLVRASLTDERFARTLRLIVESNSLPVELRAAVYCVALETVKDIVLEGAGSRVKPIRDPTVVAHVQQRFREVVESLSESSFGDKEALLGKITNINQPANRRGFSQCFQNVGVTLSVRDEQCLSLRDKFLHGKLPLEGGELTFMVNKLHFLVSTLVMKHVGYSGPILNNAAYHNWRLEDVEHHEPHYRNV